MSEAGASGPAAPLLLVADGSAALRAALRRGLESLGYDVVEADTTDAAMNSAAEHKPDLILLDLDLPPQGGRRVLNDLRDDPELRELPVIVLSRDTSAEAVVDALRAGAADYMTKPPAASELAARVAGALRVKAELDDLRRRNAELTAFAWRASHDLKSPLAAIRGMAETILSYPDRLDESTKNDLLQRIAAAAEQAATLVAGLLALARNAERKPTDTAYTPDPEAVVRGVIDQARLDEAEFDLSAAAGVWAPIAIPASDFASVILNLVVNAGFYGRSADGVLRFAVAGEQADDMLELSFADQGPGVDPVAAPRLFEPFVRGRDSRDANPRSTGIGLAIVRRTVERWGGRVELAPSETGARFVVAVPVAPAEAEE